jgi:hypothetical protein
MDVIIGGSDGEDRAAAWGAPIAGLKGQHYFIAGLKGQRYFSWPERPALLQLA